MIESFIAAGMNYRIDCAVLLVLNLLPGTFGHPKYLDSGLCGGEAHPKSGRGPHSFAFEG